jgi:hypothetical protein
MLDRGVAGHDVEQHAQPALARRREHAVELPERAEHRIDVLVVRHVIAEVVHRRGVDRRQPERVHAEPGEVVEPLLDPFQVTYAVAVRVLERARIDLIDDGIPPPHVSP